MRCSWHRAHFQWKLLQISVWLYEAVNHAWLMYCVFKYQQNLMEMFGSLRIPIVWGLCVFILCPCLYPPWHLAVHQEVHRVYQLEWHHHSHHPSSNKHINQEALTLGGMSWSECIQWLMLYFWKKKQSSLILFFCLFFFVWDVFLL